MVFVGREHELASLEAQYNSKRFELAIVYDAVAWVRRICCTTFWRLMMARIWWASNLVRVTI